MCLSGTSCYRLVTRFQQDYNRLYTDSSREVAKSLLPSTCYDSNCVLRADDIRLVGTTCCESVALVDLVTT